MPLTLIDSHAHLYAAEFDADREAVVERAQAAGVQHVVLPCENHEALSRIRDMHQQWPQWASMTLGLHPEEVGADNRAQLAALESRIGQDPIVAIGEVGIDLYWDKTYRREQLAVLDYQLHWAAEAGLPFIIHCREGVDEIAQVMTSFSGQLPLGVFHSFTGTPQQLQRLLALGDFYVGVNGIATFKRSPVPDLLPIIAPNRLLLETDAPYLAPVPHRGKRNESAHVAHTCTHVAQLLGVSPEQLAATTARNARELFGLPQAGQ